MKSLIIISIGPVQSFISQSRKLEDLWGGSYLLSYLTERAIESLFISSKEKNMEIELVYPNISENELIKKTQQQNVDFAGLPNRFVAIINSSEKEAALLARQVEKDVMEQLQEFCRFALEKVFQRSTGYMSEMSISQARDFLEFYWATESLESIEQYESARKKLEKKLAAVKNSKEFSFIREPNGLVCTICGERMALTEKEVAVKERIGQIKQEIRAAWKKRDSEFREKKQQDGSSYGRILDHETLCGICLGKRLARDYFRKKRNSPYAFSGFESVSEVAGQNSEYYAIIVMDGDDMGAWYDKSFDNSVKADSFTGQDYLKHHQELSKRLLTFASDTVPEIIKKININSAGRGQLIYAGGDDVLLMVPVDMVTTVVKDIHQSFSNPQKGLAAEATSSFGIAIVHKKNPMQAALDIARKMEKRAKKYIHPLTGQKKNAFGIALHTRSGEQRELVIPFLMNQKEQSLPILESLINGISKNYSSTFVYAIGSTILQLAGGNKKTKISILAGEKEEQQEFFDVLFARLLERSKLENQNADSKKTAQELRQFLLLFSNVGQFIHFLEIINRMAKKHTQRRGGE